MSTTADITNDIVNNGNQNDNTIIKNNNDNTLIVVNLTGDDDSDTKNLNTSQNCNEINDINNDININANDDDNNTVLIDTINDELNLIDSGNRPVNSNVLYVSLVSDLDDKNDNNATDAAAGQTIAGQSLNTNRHIMEKINILMDEIKKLHTNNLNLSQQLNMYQTQFQLLSNKFENVHNLLLNVSGSIELNTLNINATIENKLDAFGKLINSQKKENNNDVGRQRITPTTTTTRQMISQQRISLQPNNKMVLKQSNKQTNGLKKSASTVAAFGSGGGSYK